MAEVLAKKEELADRLEKANEEAIASAIAEEEQLTREIQAENSELETDNDSDFSVSPTNILRPPSFSMCNCKMTSLSDENHVCPTEIWKVGKNMLFLNN